jgi:hypothetical protein
VLPVQQVVVVSSTLLCVLHVRVLYSTKKLLIRLLYCSEDQDMHRMWLSTLSLCVHQLRSGEASCRMCCLVLHVCTAEDDQDMYRMCLSKWREQDLEGAGSDNTLLLGRPGPAGLLAQNSLPRRCAG